MRYRLFLTLIVLLALAGCDAGTETTATPIALATESATETPGALATVDTTEQPTATLPATFTVTATTPTAEQPTATPTAAMIGTPVPAVTETAVPTATGTVTSTTSTTTTVGLELIAEGFTSPVALVDPGDGSSRLFVADQIGTIHILSAEGELMAEPFLNLQDRMVTLSPDYDERGLLGLAFHPDFAENGRFFVYYSAPLRTDAPAGWDHTSYLSEFTVSADNPDTADPNSERLLLQIAQPQMNHNGGQITFGPDGYLYIPLGDGGGANDNELGHVEDWYDVNEGGNGQDLAQNLLGTILRIDVDNEGPDGELYAIPADNPFVDTAGAEAIYAYGFRNPYRISFDMGGDNALFVGDAGQDLWEEVDLVTMGGNYGWNVKEGTHCFSTADPRQTLAECPNEDPNGEPLLDPILEFQNSLAGGPGAVVIGGNVYRGSVMPDWDGRYIFGYWSSDFIAPDGGLLIATPAAEGEMWTMEEVSIASNEGGRLNAYLLSFGQDTEGEIYILTTEMSGPAGNTGKVFKLVPAEVTAVP